MKTLESLAVTAVVYQVEGKPPLTKSVAFTQRHRCGNCTQYADCAPAADVLTWKFGSWDDLDADGERRWLCQACAHAYRAADYRHKISLIDRESRTVRWPGPTELAELLDGPVPDSTALVVPVGGKRVVLPRARWGKIATDSSVFTWRPAHRKQLQIGTQLLDLGVPKGMLARPMPPPAMTREGGQRGADVLRLWHAFAPAREDKVMMPVYLRLMGTTKERHE